MKPTCKTQKLTCERDRDGQTHGPENKQSHTHKPVADTQTTHTHTHTHTHIQNTLTKPKDTPGMHVRLTKHTSDNNPNQEMTQIQCAVLNDGRTVERPREG